jgi:hypothetical protein
MKNRQHHRMSRKKLLTGDSHVGNHSMTSVAGTAAILLLLAAPAGAEDLRPLCPDRPGKGTSPCTLDAGHAQIEIDAFDASFQRLDGVTTDTYLAGAPTMKYGLTDTLDVEAAIALYERVRVHDALSETSVDGVGDLYLRAKWNFLGTGDGPFTAVLAPFVKLPTAAHDLGNGKIESGLVLPMGYDLGGGWSLGSTPEADILHDGAGTGYHLDLIDVVGIGRSFDNGVTLGTELWTSQNSDPLGATSAYSFDISAAWQPSSELQFDGGINFGLNRNTPGIQIYTGVSRRF